MVIMMIIVAGVVWMFKVFTQSQKLSNSTENKIQAIQIAREWIEAMKNIRDTNWILYWSDTANCWNVINYQPGCVGILAGNNTTTDISRSNETYKVYQDPTSNRWILEEKATPETLFSNTDYRNEMEVWYDANWFFTQSWTLIVEELKPLFTREIQVRYIDTNSDSTVDSNDEKMEVTSLVQWVDSSSSEPHKVEFTTVLTNWK